MRLNPIPRRRALRRSLCAVAASTALAAAGLAAAAPATADRQPGNGVDCGWGSTWSQPNADKAGTREVRGPINSRTVSALQVEWTVPIKAPTNRWPGSYATTPVVVDGVVYTQDLDSNVYAINVRTGHPLWTKMYNSYTNGPNGVAVTDGMVFGATKTEAFGLDARTGRELWRKSLTRNGNEAIDMAPGVHNGVVYISTVPSYLDGATASGGVGPSGRSTRGPARPSGPGTLSRATSGVTRR
jgi:glucose dehydrogenase